MKNAIIAQTPEEIRKVPLNRLWFKRQAVDFPMTDEQYEVFKKGYNPDWDCRFAPVYLDGWHYITRSGYWLVKLKYVKCKKDGLWHITAFYDTPYEIGYAKFLQIMHEGYWAQDVFSRRETADYIKRLYDIRRMPVGVHDDPKYCPICNAKVKRVFYGTLSDPGYRQVSTGKMIDAALCASLDDPTWECPKCGQGFKDVSEEWNGFQCDMEYGRAPKACKMCGGMVVPIVYGYPSAKMGEAAARGELILGGCCIEENAPDMECTWCHQHYRKRITDWI